MASASEEALDAEPAAGLVPTPVVENAMEQIEVEVVIEEDIEPSHDDKKPKIVKKIGKAKKKNEENTFDILEPANDSKGSLESNKVEVKEVKRRNLEETLTNKMKREIMSAASRKLTSVLSK